MEKTNFFKEQFSDAETEQHKNKERWVSTSHDLLKKILFASLAVALPSLVEAKEPVRFEAIWKTLTSGRSSGVEISSTVAERSLDQDQAIIYLRAYRMYNARLDSLLQLVPVNDLGVYLESCGVDFNAITPSQKDFRFLPIHEPGGNLATVLDFNPRTGKKGVVEFNTARITPTDTTRIQFISAHELGHLIRRKEPFVSTPVIEEGLANWGAWKFMKDRWSRQGLDDKEIKTRLGLITKGGAYSGETIIAALIDALYKNQNVLNNYYNGISNPKSYDEITNANSKLGGIINRDIRVRGQINASEVLNVVRYLVSKHGLEQVKHAHEALKAIYFLDMAEEKFGTLKWEGPLVYFDRTIKKTPFRTEGEMWVSASGDMVVRFKYIDGGLRRYDDILSELKEKVRAQDDSPIIHADPLMSLKEPDGSLRKEIKGTLETLTLVSR